ncbi:MAG: hypothetical protein JNM17_21915, partial [Archangium sp.]|nr:hypothetical protein [Archangium sp.]
MRAHAIHQAAVSHTEEVEGPSPAAKPSVTPATSVESWQGSTDARVEAQAAGGVALRSLQQLDARAVTEQVEQLMSRGVLDWSVSEDECRAAVGLLNSLPPAEYAKAIDALSRSGSLQTLCERVPADARGELAQSVVRGGLSKETPERLAPGSHDPRPPSQPGLITNVETLPIELREVIHAENAKRGADYKAEFARYVDASCAKVTRCRTPLELRALGPISKPPRLLEPGISVSDFKAKRFMSDLAPTNMGQEKAWRAVSARIDGFRAGLATGQAAFTAEAKGQLKKSAAVSGDVELSAGIAKEAKGTIASDGRVIESNVATERSIEIGFKKLAKVEAKLGDEHLEKVAGEVLGYGVELSRSGEVTLKAGAGEVGVEVSVNPREATMGAVLVAEEEGEFGIADVSVEGK